MEMIIGQKIARLNARAHLEVALHRLTQKWLVKGKAKGFGHGSRIEYNALAKENGRPKVQRRGRELV